MVRTMKSFDVFVLDVYKEEGCWIENERNRLGKLNVMSVSENVDGSDILSAMKGFTYSDLLGRRIRALDTTDRRRVYVEDYTGEGTWWEIGEVKEHKPIYMLRLREDEE